MRFKILIALMLLSFVAAAQPSNYTRIAQRYRWVSGMFDSTLRIPSYSGTPSGVRVNESSTIDGMIAMDTTNNRLYIYSGGSWIRLAAYTEITGGNLYIDSIWRTPGKDSIFWLKNGITYKLKDSTGGGVNIYNSDGTLTGSRDIDGGGNDITFQNIGQAIITTSDEASINSSNGVSFRQVIANNTYSALVTQNSVTGKNSGILVYSDTVKILPHNGNLYIDSLQSGSSTDSVLVWTAGTGQVKKRNVGSLVSIPTLQNVLTAGSTLTQNNAVNVGGYDLNFNNGGDFNFGGNNFFVSTISAVQLVTNINGFNENMIWLGTDSIIFRFYRGQANIDSLRSANISDTTYKKPMTWDTRNGRWEYMTQWPSGGGGGVTTVGTFSGSSRTNGASISGSTITFGPADATNPGMVSTGTQTIAGNKTFTGTVSPNALAVGSQTTPTAVGFTNQVYSSIYGNSNNNGFSFGRYSPTNLTIMEFGTSLTGTLHRGFLAVDANGVALSTNDGNTSHLYFGSGNSVLRARISASGGLSFGNGYLTTDPGANNVNIEGKLGVSTTSLNSTADISGSLGVAITTTSTNITVDDTHHTVIITGGTPTVTLPAAASGNSRRIYVIVNQTGSGVTISSYLDFTGAGNTTVAANSAIKIQSNGTNWYRIL